MAKLNLVEKKVTMELTEIVKFQLISHCYINKIELTQSDIDCYVLLGVSGISDLSEFCIVATTKNIFKTSQTVRNSIAKGVDNNIILKNGGQRKKIFLSPALNIQTKGNILLNYNIIHREASTV